MVLGYFIGVYLDSLVAEKPISFVIPLYQGLVQAIAMGVAASLSPSLFSTSNYDDLWKISIVMGAFSMAQGVVSGFVVGVLFQHFYNNANALAPEAEQSMHAGQRVAAPVDQTA
jgi:F0F1-type ATP synthase assembly protein I